MPFSNVIYTLVRYNNFICLDFPKFVFKNLYIYTSKAV